MSQVSNCEVAIIGAGPAGMAAALALTEYGLDVVVFDENPAAGGQIYRGITSSPLRDRPQILGKDYWAGEPLVKKFQACDAQKIHEAIVWAVSQQTSDFAPSHFEIGYSVNAEARLLHARHVLVATGAHERPFPIRGWTLPGVITGGAAQTLLKSNAIVPSDRIVLAGCGPLLYLIAWQYLNSGVKIDMLLDTTPKGRVLSLWPYLLDFVRSPYFLKGLNLVREVNSKVNVVKHVSELAANGVDALESITFKTGNQERTVEADHLLLHQGVMPNINLAQALGITLNWNDVIKCWEPVADIWGNTNVERVHIAGDAAGIAGAWAAESRGRLAATDIAFQLGKLTEQQRDTVAVKLRHDYVAVTRGREFFDRLFQPPVQFRRPTGDTVVCRCEEITASQVRETVKIGCTGPNQMKSFLRCGMGPCQGRFCAVTVTELIADERNVPEQDVGHYRLRFPTKPLTLGELAALPQTEDSIKAVVRLKKPV